MTTTDNRTLVRTLVATNALALTVAGLSLGKLAFADGPTPTAPRVIPYEGILELDGESVAGTKSFAFEIWDSPDGGSRLWPIDATPDGQLESVPLTNGRFAVQLGGEGMDALPDSVFSAPVTYLTVSVDGVALSNRQRLVNPWLAANGPVTINGTLDVNGAVTATSTAVETDLSVGGVASVLGSANFGGSIAVAGGVTANAAQLANTDYNGTIGGALRIGTVNPMVIDDDEINASAGERLYLSPRTRGGVSAFGLEVDGTNSVLRLETTGGSEVLLLDGNEVVSNGRLYFNTHSNQPVEIGTDFDAPDNERDLCVWSDPPIRFDGPQYECPRGMFMAGINVNVADNYTVFCCEL